MHLQCTGKLRFSFYYATDKYSFTKYIQNFNTFISWIIGEDFMFGHRSKKHYSIKWQPLKPTNQNMIIHLFYIYIYQQLLKLMYIILILNIVKIVFVRYNLSGCLFNLMITGPHENPGETDLSAELCWWGCLCLLTQKELCSISPPTSKMLPSSFGWNSFKKTEVHHHLEPRQDYHPPTLPLAWLN